MTAEPPNCDQLLDRAEQIFKAQLISAQREWSGVGVNRHIATFVRFRVLESYRGSARGEQNLEFLDGTGGDLVTVLPGLPEFQPGGVEVLFVSGSHINFCPLVGVYFGRFRVVRDATDGRKPVFLHDGAPLIDVAVTGREHGTPTDSDARFTGSGAITSKEFAVKIRDGSKWRGITPDYE